MEKRQAFRHGDIVFERIPAVPSFAVGKLHQHLVIAKGEATGHAHVLDGEVMTFGSIDDLLLSGPQAREIRVTKSSTVTHPEHKPITLPVGSYTVRRQREFWGQERIVRD